MSVDKRFNGVKISKFRELVVKFLGDVAPGSKGSLTVGGMPNFFVGCFCDRFTGFFKMLYNLWAHKALWRSEKVFKPVIDEEMVHPDGSRKKFVELGRDLEGNLKCSLAVTTTDLGFGQSMVFTNETEGEELHFVEGEHRKILNRDSDVFAYLPMSASAAIPFAFSPVKYPPDDKPELQTDLADGGAVSNLSAQLLRQRYGRGRSAPVRFALSCNEFKYRRDVAYEHGTPPPIKTKSWGDFLFSVFGVVIEDGMADDIDLFLKSGGSEEHIFITRAGEISQYPTPEDPFLKEPISNFGFFSLNRVTCERMFEFGRVLTKEKLIDKMSEKEIKRAKRNGVSLALSGGGALYPVLFGAVFAMWEHFEVKAIAGTSAGALTASYMAEKIARQED